MQSYKRKITYFYQHQNGKVGSTAGFLKLEIRGDKVKIIINIQESSGLPFKEASLYFYHEAGDHLAAIKVDQVSSVHGVLTYQNKVDWQYLFDTGRDLYTFDGVVVAYNENNYYVGDFQDRDRRDYPITFKGKKKVEVPKEQGENKYRVRGRQGEQDFDLLKTEIGKIKELVENVEDETRINGIVNGKDVFDTKEENQEFYENMKNKEMGIDLKNNQAKEESNSFNENYEIEYFSKEKEDNIYKECETCPYYRKKIKNEEEDAFEQMLEEYPKLSIYGSTELFQCVRMIPKDIGKLDIRNWKLGVNSFLVHGYYTYQYLLLGKMRFEDGSEHPIIGVPGVYSNREKYLANMFGFEQFVPVKNTGIKTGTFGYWIVEISPYL